METRFQYSTKNEGKVKPWIRKPLELLGHAEKHYKNGKDYDKQVAYVIFDNSIEISILIYMDRNCESNGNKKYTRKDTPRATNFYEKLEVFKKVVTTKGLPMKWDIEAIKRHHKQRNKFYHEGTLSIPESMYLDEIRDIAFWVFGVLFDVPDVNATLEESGEMSEKMFLSIPEDYAEPKIHQKHANSLLLLGEVIKRLQAYDKGFNLYYHKNIKGRWEISYTKGKIEQAYPLKALAGKKTHIDIQRLKVIAKHFSIPDKVFALTVKEIKNRNWDCQ